MNLMPHSLLLLVVITWESIAFEVDLLEDLKGGYFLKFCNLFLDKFKSISILFEV
jgi:hypothetical protein